MVKVGVIGCGTIGNAAHLPAYTKNPRAELAYVCDIIPERAQKAAGEYGGKAVTDYREVLADPQVSAVSVCTPNNTHSTITVAALDAGKNVLCEKPAARCYADALVMQEAQRRSAKTLNIGVVNRFNTAVNVIKKLIDTGELGNIYHVYVSFRAHRSIPGLGGAFTTKEIAGGGVLIDWGVHYLDLAMYCLGDPEPKTVSSQAYSVLGRPMEDYSFLGMWAGPPDYSGTYDVEDFVTGLIRTGGPTISLNGAWAQNIGVSDTYIDFLGDKAGVRLVYGQNFKLYTAKGGALFESTPEFAASDMFYDEIDSFLGCVENGGKTPANIDYAIRTSRIMQAIYDSSDAKKEVIL